jgi:hypothetical protein
MIKLDRNYYLLHNTGGDNVNRYDDPMRLIGWLMGKQKYHRNYIIHVIKGDKARLLTIPDDLIMFQKTLLDTMNSL